MLKDHRSQFVNLGYESTLPGPDDITRIQLPNKIVVLNRENFNSPSIVVRGYLPAGSIFDSEEKLGLADFLLIKLFILAHS